MAFAIDCILAVSVVWPDAVGQKLELADIRPGRDLVFVMEVTPLYLLQQNHVLLGILQVVLDFVQHEIAIVTIEALVDVIGQYLDHLYANRKV